MPDPDETQRFDALLDAMLTKPGPDDVDAQQDDGDDLDDRKDD